MAIPTEVPTVQRLQLRRPTDKQMEALQRLWVIANGVTGQCGRVARFLLGLYNGERFPFDLTDFRCLDREIFEDCLTVLDMDSQPIREVHQLLGQTSDRFERLAEDWGLLKK